MIIRTEKDKELHCVVCDRCYYDCGCHRDEGSRVTPLHYYRYDMPRGIMYIANPYQKISMSTVINKAVVEQLHPKDLLGKQYDPLSIYCRDVDHDIATMIARAESIISNLHWLMQEEFFDRVICALKYMQERERQERVPQGTSGGLPICTLTE